MDKLCSGKLYLFVILLASAILGCGQDELAESRILIGEIPLVADIDLVFKKLGSPMDSGKTTVNACFYFESDSCTYYKFSDGLVYLSDNGKLHFSSFRYFDSAELVVSIGEMKVSRGMSNMDFEQQAKRASLHYQAVKYTDQQYIYSIRVKNGCDLSFIFRNGKIESVLYGYYGFVRPVVQ